jgi:putative ABC transport system ATP-binding protein
MWDDSEVILRLEDVRKRYARRRGDRDALNGISLELRRGEIMGIYGPSGAGKTTLLRLAAGLESPDVGVVSYKGERLDQMSAAQLRRYHRREVGCIWASKPSLTGLSVLEDVALPLLMDRCDHRIAERTARKFLLACEAQHCIGVDPEDLSDGERQRVAIARALVTEPRLLLADGAVSNLSVVEQETIMALLSSLAHQAKVAVLITDPTARAMLGADPILYMRDGKLAGGDSATQQAKVYHLPAAASRRFAADA